MISSVILTSSCKGRRIMFTGTKVTVSMDAIKLENDALHTNSSRNSNLNVGYKLDPYDDVVYLGRSIGPLVNIDSDNDDELLYISTSRDEGIKVKPEINKEADVIDIEESDNDSAPIEVTNIKSEIGEESKRKRQETGFYLGNKKRKQISTKPMIKRSPSEKNEPWYIAKKTSTTTQSEEGISQNHKSNTATGQVNQVIPSQREGKTQEKFSPIHKYNPNCKAHLKSKLGYRSINSQTYFLKYAEDYFTGDELMFVYKSQDDSMRVFVKSEKEELFLKAFYDHVTCQHAGEDKRWQILPGFQKYILQTLKQRRSNYLCPDYRCTFTIPVKLVRHGNDFIIMAIYNSDGRRVLVTCSAENCTIFRICNHFMPSFNGFLNTYENGENVITECSNEFSLLKESFLRWMTGKAC